MNRKFNPVLSVVALVLLAAILLLICSGCGTTTEAANNRFTSENAGKLQDIGFFYIITDTQTGVQYLLADIPNGGGLTKLEE